MASYAEQFLKSATSAASLEDSYFTLLSNALTSCAEAGTRYFTDMMSPTQQHDENKMKEVLCVSFNQDSSCLAVGHEDGYVFYTPKAVDNLEKLQEGKMPKRVYIVERLYNSSLITMVSKNSTRKLQVYHSIKDNEIVSSTYTGAILSVRLNRKRVVVCLEDAIHIHNVRDMKLLHIIKDTPLNPLGIIDLSADDSASYLAFPGSSSTGHVMVFDTEALAATCSFSAHAGPLVALRFSPDGTKLATASDKGTVIRVFGIPNGDRLFEFTRGVKRCVTISSLAFSIDSKYLCLSSNTETVHVFSLVRQEGSSPEQTRQDDLSAQEGIGAWVNYFSQQATAYLPTHMNELMLREKSVAIARLPISDTKTAVAMPRIAGKDYLMVASTEGYLFLYMLDTESGECPLIRQYRIGPNADDMDNSGTPIPLNTNSANTRPVSSDFDTLPSSGGQTGKTTSGGSTGSGGEASAAGAGGSPDAGWSSVKPPPPPIPPAPKKRGGSNADAASAGGNISQKNGKSGGNNNPFDGKASRVGKPLAGGGGGLISTNPFEVDDTYLYEDDELDKGGGGGGAKRRSGGGETDSSLEAPADLNDMDEFPPLSHVTL